MKFHSSLPCSCIQPQISRRKTRGSVLITALIFAIIIAITLVSAITLSRNNLNLAHRTFFADAAENMAETGLEEAVWSFNQMGSSTSTSAVNSAWGQTSPITGQPVWNLGNTISNIYISQHGNGYTSAPTVTISGGGGSGAAATAVVSTYVQSVNGVDTTYSGVTSFNITNPGSGYTSTPTITLSGGGGTGAAALAGLAATKKFSYSNVTTDKLDQNATGYVNVWVAGYDGNSPLPMIVAKAVITPFQGPTIEKYIKMYLSKNGLLAKGVVALNGINWNGHPLSDSFKSSTVPGVPPFTNYDPLTARPNTIVADLVGTIDLSQGTVKGNVLTGPGVNVTGGNITGSTIGNFSYNYTYPAVPTNSGATAGYPLAVIPTVLPRAPVIVGGTVTAPADPASGRPAVITGGTVITAGDTPAADGKYYYYVNGLTIGDVTISAGSNVVIVGTGGTNMNIGNSSGIKVPSTSTTASPANVVGSATIYMDGPITISGNGVINKIASPNSSWSGALNIYTSTSSDISMSGNAAFYGSIFAPYASLVGNGGGNTTEDLSGSFVFKDITSNGHMNLHFDEGLGGQIPAKPWALTLWTELQSASDRAPYVSLLNF